MREISAGAVTLNNNATHIDIKTYGETRREEIERETEREGAVQIEG